MINVSTIIRDDYIRKDGTCSVYLQLYMSRRRVVVDTGVSVPLKDWDKAKRQVKRSHPMASDYNLIIGKAHSLANEILVKFRLEGRPITPSVFRKEFRNPSTLTDFNSWMHREINERKGLIGPGTIDIHITVLNNLKSFRKQVYFSDIDEIFIQDFEKYLKITLKNSLNTVSKKLRALRSYLNRAKRRGLIRSNPFEGYAIRKGKGRITYLTEEELRRLLEMFERELIGERYKRVLVYFLFACFTGLRISDVRKLTHSMIINDLIILVPKKKENTDMQTITIPLSKPARGLIKKYNPHRVAGKVFDTFTEQYTNRLLKEIMQLAKIRKKVTFHVARHTFATLFLEKTNDVATLQKLLGHSSITQTMVYAHVSEKKKQKQIKVFDKFA